MIRNNYLSVTANSNICFKRKLEIGSELTVCNKVGGIIRSLVDIINCQNQWKKNYDYFSFLQDNISYY